jgi:hypothetical protein
MMLVLLFKNKIVAIFRLPEKSDKIFGRNF